jgi:hypothetical protein
VPERLYVLPLRFKKSMLNISIFRGTVKTVSGVYIYPTRIMLYRVANEGLKWLEELAGYRYLIHYYCFRRWMTNESNRKWQYTLISRHRLSLEIHYLLSSYLSHLIANQSVFLAGYFTERKRNRILGYLGSAIFEKYYYDNRIHRDIQNVVLLRPL